MGCPCFVLGAKLPAAGRHVVVNSANCHGCDTARCPPVFVVASLFITDNNLAKGTCRCCWNHTAGVDEGINKPEKDYRVGAV